MPWYVICRNPSTYKVLGLLMDEKDEPMEYPTEEAAHEAMRDHMLENSCEYIELD